jgi:hypothetical protein
VQLGLHGGGKASGACKWQGKEGPGGPAALHSNGLSNNFQNEVEPPEPDTGPERQGINIFWTYPIYTLTHTTDLYGTWHTRAGKALCVEERARGARC